MDPVYNYMQSYPYQMHYWPHTYPPQPPVNHECWPWGGNYGYASPVACHGCSNHSYLPYSHVPTAHCPRYYPLPVQYMPPPYYTMHQPQYEYEKNVPINHHCPNHQCHQKEQKNIRIEEEEPVMERRKNDSLVPFQLKNYPYPYPIVYLPRDFGNNKEHDKVVKPEHKEGKDLFLEAKPEEDRNVWNLGSLDQRGEGERKREKQDDGNGRFPFPIIWMPYETEENEKKTHKVNNDNQEASLNINGEHNGGHVSSKLRDIPVKEVEQREEKVKDGNDKAEKKLAKDGSKSSSPKSSKLPPVCLRVDPLPRRKKASNGSSRSPSPPGDNRKLDQLSSNEARQATENKIKEGDIITKPIEIADGVSTNQTEDKLKEENISLECHEDGELCRDEDVNKDETQSSKVKLTDEEAAVIIQSAYRGFDVRRWAPVKKLKQIAKVREQIGDVKKRIQALEMSSDVQYSSKERNIIAEIIMSLLLKLDTIQGLHPCVREVRKSVVRELVSLQEKLDFLLHEKSEAAAVQESTTKHDEEASEEPVGIMITQLKNANEAQSELPEPYQHDLDTEAHNEMVKNSEESVNGEQTGKKLELTSEPIIAKEDEKIEKLNEDDEVSIAEKMEDHEDINVGQNNSTMEMTDVSSSELLEGVPEDCSYTSEGVNRSQFEEDISRDDQQRGEVVIETSIISPELKIDPTNEENKEHVKLNEEINGIADILEPYEASDKRELPIEEAIEGGKDASGDLLLHYDLGVMDSNNSVGKEISSSQQDPESHLDQEKIPIHDSAVIYDPPNIIGEVHVEGELEQKEAYQVANESVIDTPLNIEVLNECKSEHLLPKEYVEAANHETSTGNEKNGALERDELIEANGKLMEENERLRDMMEKLIQSGQQQLTAISSLSGKVKDLERRLNKKKKLKMKAYREPRARSRAYLKEMSNGVAI